MKIPVIDLKNRSNHPEDLKQITAEIELAFVQHGFAYLINHNTPQNVIDATFRQSKAFHQLPLDEKMQIVMNKWARGYVPMKASQLKVSTEGRAAKPNVVDSFLMAFEVNKDHQDYVTGDYLAGPNQWPATLKSFKSTIYDYRDHLLSLSTFLMKPVSNILFGNTNDIKSYFEDPTYFLRLLHYPSQQFYDPEQDGFGIAPHTDYGCFTLLAQQDVSGLEVRVGDQWIIIPPLENSLIINAGDMLKRWSNNYLTSSPHRVINKSHNDRYSIAFFFEPNMHSVISVSQKYINSNNNQQYDPIMYGDYLMERAKNNYKLKD